MKDKVKNKSKKVVVEAYQRQVQVAVNEIMAREGKMIARTKDYVRLLEENIRLAPYTLGYLEIPEPKKKKQE